MFSNYSRAVRRPSVRSFLNQIVHFQDFKPLVNRLIERIPLARRFRPRLYTYADYVLVKLYALLTKKSTDWASETLNKAFRNYFAEKYHLHLKQYADHSRHRRLIPHQTEVDKFFRRFTEKEVLSVFGNLLTALNRQAQSRYIGGTSMRLIVDNTEYGYYGKPTPPFDIGTTRMQGTKVCRMFQGHAIHGCGMTLFTDFKLLRKSVYRARDIPSTGKWLKFCGYNISYALMDREFYRAALIKDLKTDHIPVIIPAKKYRGVKRMITDFLLGVGPLVQQYHFAQSTSQYAWQKSVHVSLVVVGHKDLSAMEIRNRFRQHRLSFDEALRKLSAFFTTLPRWRNINRWTRFLTKAYKKRWNEETGFRELNVIHRQFRYRSPVVQLAELYLRALIYNGWQIWRKERKSAQFKNVDRSLDVFSERLTGMIEQEINSSVSYNIRSLQKSRRDRYFKKEKI